MFVLAVCCYKSSINGLDQQVIVHIDIECLVYRQSIEMKFVVAFLACIVVSLKLLYV